MQDFEMYPCYICVYRI